MVSPLIDEIADEQTQVKVGKVNVDEQPALAEQFGIMSIPTLVVLKNGEVIKKRTGAGSKQDILAML